MEHELTKVTTRVMVFDMWPIDFSLYVLLCSQNTEWIDDHPIFVYLNKYGWMDGWMEWRVVSPPPSSVFFWWHSRHFSAQEFSTRRKTKDISRDPSIHPSNHPKENVRQLLREWADIWCAYRYAEIWQGYKAVLVVDDGRMLVLLDHLSESRFFLVS